jgi:L-iditol 2-dehydrogenase
VFFEVAIMDQMTLKQIVRDVVKDFTTPENVKVSGKGDHPSQALFTRPKFPETSTSAKTVRAGVLKAKETLEIREFPLRAIREDEILVKIEGCGICGTDIHCYKHDPFQLCPVVLGHEGTGRIVEIGAKWKIDSVGKPLKVGDKVVTSLLETSAECMIAKYNPMKANLCDDIRIYGLLPDEPDNHLNGYFAEYLIVRPGSSIFVVNDMSLKLRVLIEPATVVCHALERAKRCGATLNFRSRVIVQGCGPIGLLMIAVLRTYGINNIIAIDGNESRLSVAQKLGADHTINYKEYANAEGVADQVKSLTKGFGAHFAFQVTGVPQAASNLFKYVRRGGAICEVGHFVDAGTSTFNPHEDICKKEMTLIGSWAYGSWEYPNAYHFLSRAAQIGLPVEDLVTHEYPLSRIDEAFKANIAQEGIKLMVVPD